MYHIMQHIVHSINGLYLLAVVATAIGISVSFYLQKNPQLKARPDHAPLQEAKKDWRWSLAGGAKEAGAAERWDTLAEEVIMNSKSFRELDSAYESCRTYYFFWIFLKIRESAVIDEAFKERHQKLHEDSESVHKTNLQSFSKPKATRLGKIDEQNKEEENIYHFPSLYRSNTSK